MLTWPVGAGLSVVLVDERVMGVAEVCRVTGATRKALRGYEDIGLINPERADNGYRCYGNHEVRVIETIRELNQSGIPLSQMRPFVDCLNTGSEYADDCPATLAEYRHAIDRIDRMVETLTTQRAALVANLATASFRMVGTATAPSGHGLPGLPSTLPAPADDGAAEGLAGRALPDIELPSTDGSDVWLRSLGAGRTLIYVFPMTGMPGRICRTVGMRFPVPVAVRRRTATSETISLNFCRAASAASSGSPANPSSTSNDSVKRCACPIRC